MVVVVSQARQVYSCPMRKLTLNQLVSINFCMKQLFDWYVNALAQGFPIAEINA